MAALDDRLDRLTRQGWVATEIAAPNSAGDASRPSFVQPLLAGGVSLVAIKVSGAGDGLGEAARLIEASLGVTPFCVEAAQRVLLIYRWSGSARENETWFPRSGVSIEFAWGGAPIPLEPDASWGAWRRHPAAFGPASLPVVTEDGQADLLERIHSIAPIAMMEAVHAAPASAQDVSPLTPTGKLGVPWRVDHDSVVVRGQKHWVKAVARHQCARRPKADRALLREATKQNALQYLPGQYLAGEAGADLERWLDDAVGIALLETTKAARRPYRAQAKIARIRFEPSQYEPEWLADIVADDARSDIAAIENSLGKMAGVDEASLDRGNAKETLSDVVVQALDAFMDDVDRDAATVRVVNVPPGVGKTTLTISRLLFDADRRSIKRPIAVLMPNYANIGEIRDRIEAVSHNITWLPIVSQDGRPPDIDMDAVKIMVFAGRIHAGCMIPEKMALANEIGQGGSLCHAKDQDGEDVFCPHYQTCPAIAQRRQVKIADIVLMPHQFLCTMMPGELAIIKGVIIDERTDGLFIQSRIVTLEELSAPRRRVKTTKAMRAEGVTADILISARNAAWEAITVAASEGADPVYLVATKPELRRACELAVVYGEALLQRDIQVSPFSSLDALQAAAERPVGRFLEEERQFWSILMEDVAANRVSSPRLKWVTGPGGELAVRIAWRDQPNWPDVPKLLLDGSASTEIIERIWTDMTDASRAPVIEHRARDEEVIANSLLPTILIQGDDYAKSGMVPRGDMTDNIAVSAACAINRVRRLITILAGRNADGRVLVGGMKAVNRVVCEAWKPPSNVDFCHYGAIRGLNSFERHKIAVSIGRLELPPDVLDGLASALGFDDPEWIGPDPEQSAIAGIKVVMRDGRSLEIPSPVAGERWSRAVQSVSREEELRQFAGRLRSIQRIDSSYPDLAWVVVGNVVPENTVLDALISAEDVMADRYLPLFEAARRTGGVIIGESYQGIIDDLYPNKLDPKLFEEFAKSRTVARAWRRIERQTSRGSVTVMVPRHMPRDEVEARVSLALVAPCMSGLVMQISLDGGAEYDDAGSLNGEAAAMANALKTSGFNPDADAPEGTMGGLPYRILWPNQNGALLPISVAAAGECMLNLRREHSTR